MRLPWSSPATPPATRRLARWSSSALVALAAAATIAGLAGCAATPSAQSASPSHSASATPRAGAASGIQNPDTTSLSTTPAPGVVPTRISIPAISVNANLQNLAIAASGELNPPTNGVDAGWYAKGVVPGAVGPAIIAGHIDTTTGPAVFLHLNQLAAGDRVMVTMSSGSIETWSVTGSEQSPKSNFPTSSVYGTTPTPALRLISCQGVFNPAIGHYDDNLIVFADLVSSTPPTK